MNEMNLEFPKNLIEAGDLSKNHLQLLFEKAKYFEENFNPKEKFPDLKGFTIALAFFENSTRTKLSFELAAKRLSADILNFAASGSSLAKGESLADTIRTIDAMYVNMYVVRHQSSGVPQFLRKITSNIIVNAGDGKHEHPTQALLDAYTLLKHFKQIEGRKISIVGDILHSRVARSNITMLQTLGAKLKLFAPGTLLPRHLNCWDLELFDNIDEVVEWSDAVILLRLQKERMNSGLLPSIEEFAKFYQLNFDNFMKNDKLILLHPGPVNYGIELDYRISKLHNSFINQQVTNGVFTRMAVMSLLSEANKS
jgi:aspartate carbamoyltransferase catalytic subunit